MDTDTRLLESIRDMRAKGADTDTILMYLRSQGCSKIETIHMIRRLLEIPPNDAKLLVHNSKAWEFRRESDEAFHRQLYDALDEWEKDAFDQGDEAPRSPKKRDDVVDA